MEITLSYLISTRNRLPFLQITLLRLTKQLQPGEEIVVVDGNSTDGSKAYLQALFDEGKIHTFVSEPDHNQAHGWNKAMLMASGTIIKKIIDDDVFDYEAIRNCSKFMLENPQVDVCISNSLNSDINQPERYKIESRLPWYREWKTGKKHSFTFSDVHMLIRRSALSYIGLYDTQFVMIDWEYSLRISFLQCKIAFYTGYNAMSVNGHENVTSSVSKKLLETEGLIGRTKYHYEGDDADIGPYSKFKIHIGTILNHRSKRAAKPLKPTEHQLELMYDNLYQALIKHNESLHPEFIV